MRFWWQPHYLSAMPMFIDKTCILWQLFIVLWATIKFSISVENKNIFFHRLKLLNEKKKEETNSCGKWIYLNEKRWITYDNLKKKITIIYSYWNDDFFFVRIFDPVTNSFLSPSIRICISKFLIEICGADRENHNTRSN